MHRLSVALAALLLVGCVADTTAPSLQGPSGMETALQASVPAATTATSSLEPSPSVPPNLGVAVVTSGLDLPSGITVGPDGELYVNETRSGLVRVVAPDGTLRQDPFLDLADRIRGDGERGLLGFALHPDYESNRRLFVHYTRQSDGAVVVSEFTADESGASADVANERVLMTIEHPSAYHNGGQLAFGPDGYLYIGIGDGGSRGDSEGNAQNAGALLGKILRIDVNAPSDTGRAYAIPPGNPFAAGGGSAEVFVIGVRNPWRFSFDSETGALWVADVGEGAVEEINRLEPASAAGANLGWSVMEGSTCYYLLPCDPALFEMPLTEYGRDSGCAVIGGVVARGDSLQTLSGWYLFADYCEGTIFGVPADAEYARNAPVRPTVLLETGLPITAFGQAPSGEVYVADIIGGAVYVIEEQQ